jgi:glycerophosphoryl diester phosphodiesterase
VSNAARLDLPRVIGHRGAAAHAPENTLAGFRAARLLGCTWIEFDVRLTADGALVVCHDDKLKRTTNGRGRISKKPLAEIRHLDAGSWFGGGFAGEVVPTLDEALALCRQIGLGANVEIKAAGPHGSATAAAMAACLDRLSANLPPILVSSFLADAVSEAARQMPSVPRGMLWRKLPRNWAKVAARLGCATIHCGHADLTSKLAAEICAAHLPLLCYTVNDAARARQLFDWGVASVFSDAPDIIDPALAGLSAGAHWGALS